MRVVSNGNAKDVVSLRISQGDGSIRANNTGEIYPRDSKIEGIVTGFRIAERPGRRPDDVDFVLVLDVDDVEPGYPRKAVECYFGSNKAISPFGLRLLAKINSADLRKPLTIQPRSDPAPGLVKTPPLRESLFKEDKCITSIIVSQVGCALPELYANGWSALPLRPERADGHFYDAIADELFVQLSEKFKALALMKNVARANELARQMPEYPGDEAIGGSDSCLVQSAEPVREQMQVG